MKPRTTLYLVNVKGAEIEDYKKIHKKFETVGFAGLKSVKKNSVVVVEDIISMSAEEERSLRKAINYEAHHKKCKLYCITHTIYKTSMYSMLPLFHYVVYTSSPSNSPIMRASLAYFRVEKETIAEWLSLVKEASKTSSVETYYFFDCSRMLFCQSFKLLLPGTTRILGDLDGEGSTRVQPSEVRPRATKKVSKENSCDREAETERMKQLFSDFFQGQPFQPQACAIFSIVLGKLGSSKINPLDLTITFSSRQKKGGTKKLSVVDYVASLLAPTGRASRDQAVLHNYIARQCTIPQSCIRNKWFTTNVGRS